MSFIVRAVAAFALLGTLGACASGASSEAMTPAGVVSVQASNAFASNVYVAPVEGGQSTNPLWTSEISGQDFGTALQSALADAGMYAPDGDYSLEARLVSVEQPMIGIALTVTTTVEYNLRDANGSIVFSETIATPYTAQFSEAFMAVTRLKLANEGSAEQNISEILSRLRQAGQRIGSVVQTS
ncbi:hypothetical protein [Roseobacter sp. HKCCA0434]|uniref:hypothetical protein n=1 Tax=Roseobacter sp. HKCCA0434 TaxID=3079297 RepID=UPI002905CB0F|nr:hypothetical protein [Roseobacter sp. HKCCA0434]